jgi:hypothetical protein
VTRLWITAQPSASEVVLYITRNRLRRSYRDLRRVMPRHEARWIVANLVTCGSLRVKS